MWIGLKTSWRYLSAHALLLIPLSTLPVASASPTDARAEELVRAMAAAAGEAQVAAKAGNTTLSGEKYGHVRFTGVEKLRPLKPAPSAKWRGMGEYWIGLACMESNDPVSAVEAFEKAVLYLGQALDEERGETKGVCSAYLGRTRMFLTRDWNHIYSAEERAQGRSRAVSGLEGTLASATLSRELSGTVRGWLGELRTEPETGDLEITSDPDGAAIVLDGDDLGQLTPYTIKHLPPGQHTIALQLRNYQPSSAEVAVVSGVTSGHSTVLQPIATTGAIAGRVLDDDRRAVPGAAVSLDGAGPREFSDLAGFHFPSQNAGEHSLTIAAPGYVQQVLRIDVVAGETVVVDVSLQREVGTVSGRVVDVMQQPIATATVWLDGAQPITTGGTGEFMFGEVPTGLHIVKVAAGEYKEHEQTVSMNWSGNILLHAAIPHITAQNDTDTAVRLHLSWHEPANGRTEGTWDVRPGEETRLTSNGASIRADQLKHWAESGDGRTTWRYDRMEQTVQTTADTLDSHRIVLRDQGADDWIAMISETLDAEQWHAALELAEEFTRRRPEDNVPIAALRAVALISTGESETARGELAQARAGSSLSVPVEYVSTNVFDWAMKLKKDLGSSERHIVTAHAWLVLGDLRRAERACDEAVEEYNRAEFLGDEKRAWMPAVAHLLRGSVRYAAGDEAAAISVWSHVTRIVPKKDPVNRQAKMLIANTQ